MDCFPIFPILCPMLYLGLNLNMKVILFLFLFKNLRFSFPSFISIIVIDYTFKAIKLFSLLSSAKECLPEFQVDRFCSYVGSNSNTATLFPNQPLLCKISMCEGQNVRSIGNTVGAEIPSTASQDL